MATRHTYASSDDLRDYLAGTSYSSGWTADGNAIRRILEAASVRIDQYVGGGTFGPVTETHYGSPPHAWGRHWIFSFADD